MIPTFTTAAEAAARPVRLAVSWRRTASATGPLGVMPCNPVLRSPRTFVRSQFCPRMVPSAAVSAAWNSASVSTSVGALAELVVVAEASVPVADDADTVRPDS